MMWEGLLVCAGILATFGMGVFAGYQIRADKAKALIRYRLESKWQIRTTQFHQKRWLNPAGEPVGIALEVFGDSIQTVWNTYTKQGACIASGAFDGLDLERGRQEATKSLLDLAENESPDRLIEVGSA